MDGVDYYEYPAAFETVTAEDVEQFLRRVVQEERAAISMVWPKGGSGLFLLLIVPEPRDHGRSRTPLAFTVFGKDIYWYGIIIALGFLLAVIYMMRRAPVFGLTQDDLLDEVLWAVPIGVICARLDHCIFYWELYAANPISVLYIWEGGLAIYGGVIGGAITILVLSRVKKIPTRRDARRGGDGRADRADLRPLGQLHEPRGAREP